MVVKFSKIKYFGHVSKVFSLCADIKIIESVGILNTWATNNKFVKQFQKY